ncbi:phospholipase A1 member A-like [Danaus plexippus]|uniref:phospholipase A1 member A-like n=1 Tax=Danaus plexippus TaxID=13037 RepID=UPI002AB00B4C|nr:phospholipase A1 member A-like [Danaus plexippus]
MMNLLVLIATVLIANAVPLQAYSIFDSSGYTQFEKINRFDVNEPVDNNLSEKGTEVQYAVQYLLFTRKNPRVSESLFINNANSITKSNFNPGVPTVVIVHGWLGNQYSDINPTIRDAYLDKSDVNIIVLDWAVLAMLNYPTAAAGVPNIGRELGRFLSFLNEVTGAPYNRMHLIGFSLGAHIVGNAGRKLGGRIARVTGLDPAGPLWTENSNRFRSTDGIYTEAIHTNGSPLGFGIEFAVADVDFFVNGGKSQPGCLDNLCNHNRAWEVFAATVTYDHLVGRQCANTLQITYNMCRGSSLSVGNDNLNKTGAGIYVVNTNRSYPF